MPFNPPDNDPQPHERPVRSRAISTGPPRLTPFRELQLVEAYRKGDSEAMLELLQAYQRRVYSVCYRMVRDVDEASDLTQDALVKIIEGLDGYDGRSKLSTWVIRVTINCVLSHLRKKKVRRMQSLDSHDVRSDTDEHSGSQRHLVDEREPEPLQRIEQDEQRRAVQRAMLRLDPDVRAILVLRDLQGLDYEQIGEVLEVPVGTVKSRLFRARAALRDAVVRETGGG
jgi:RNA polymerase sigma-70 factor, ECF subfamily